MFLHNAQWIYLDEPDPGADSVYGAPSPYFRKEFLLKGKLKRATAQASAMGVFKLYINGREADNDLFSPGYTDYRTRIPFVEYDITHLVKGNNALGIVTGDGWALGNLGWDRLGRCNYYDRVEVIAALKLEYEDGSREHIYTDGSWRVSTGEILRSDFYMGEYVDRRLSLGSFSEPGYNDSSWRSVCVCEHPRAVKQSRLEKAIAPKTTVKHTLTPQLLTKTSDGTLIYDFSQNMVGVPEIEIAAEVGAKVTMTFGEVLDEKGCIFVENLRKAESIDVYIASGENSETICPLFTFHGFRYMGVRIDGAVEILSVKGKVIYSDLAETADFSCSDELVSRLYQNIVWGQRGNFLNVPTDCPQRDERLGWLGDAQIFCGTAMFNMDCRDFFRKFLCDIRDAQYANGACTGFAPINPRGDGIKGLDGFAAAAGWAEAIMIIPHEHYLMYGDKRIISDNICSIKKYVEYLESICEGCIRPPSYNYGDWLSAGEETDISVVATLYYAYAAHLTSKLCRILNDSSSSYYEELYDNIKKAFRAHFIGSNNVIKSDTQTAYLLAYAFGIMTADEVRSNLVRAVKRMNGHLSTGFLGVKFLLPVLCDLGETELAYKLLTNRTNPSWCYSVLNGATTIWERWDSYKQGEKMKNPSMNSLNHYSLGSVGEWMFKYCLGILPDIENAGFKEVTLKPYFDTSGKITSAKGHYDSLNGRISAEWHAENGGFMYVTSVPNGIRAEYDFSMYKNVQKISEGKFFITI